MRRFDDIKIPENIDKLTKKGIKKAEKEKRMKRFKKPLMAGSGVDGKFLDSKSFVGVASYYFDEGTKVPDSFKIGIDIRTVSLNSVEDDALINGEWNFDIDVKKGAGTEIIKPNIVSGDITVKELQLGSFKSIGRFEVPASYSEERQIEVYDDKGEEINYTFIWDENKNGDRIDYLVEFDAIGEDAKSLTFKFIDEMSMIEYEGEEEKYIIDEIIVPIEN